VKKFSYLLQPAGRAALFHLRLAREASARISSTSPPLPVARPCLFDRTPGRA
jgi:hypothetical protein